MAEKKQKDCQWFLVTEDPHTNEVIAAELARLNESAGNDVSFVDVEGRPRNGWRVTYAVLNQFLKASRIDGRLKLDPYVKEAGRYRLWKIGRRKKVSRKVGDIKDRLAELPGKE